MLVLGIETSCDETGVALVEEGRRVLSRSVSSSLPYHRRFGGIIPEIAARAHIETLLPLLRHTLREAGVGLEDVGLIAATSRPGLVGSLLVGTSFTRALAWARNLPFVEVDHILAHMYACRFSRPVTFPAVGLVVSGGHTSLYYLKGWTQTQLVGQTQDDACGEAFDKVARILGLGYPGGPAIDKLTGSFLLQKRGFRPSRLRRPFDFSFSGLKTAVLYRWQNSAKDNRICRELAADFQETIVEDLLQKSFLACQHYKASMLLVGGGVACNRLLRLRLKKEAKRLNINICLPPPELCLDNAVMVAGLGFHIFKSRPSVFGFQMKAESQRLSQQIDI